MKTITKVLLLALAPAFFVGCVEPDGKNNGTEGTSCFAGCENEEEEEEEQPETSTAPDLKGSFVSGHLGNYRDCPQDGYQTPSDGASSMDEGAFGAPAEGDCAEGESCPGILNCEDAQITIRLSNGGEADASEIEVTKIELFTSDGVSVAVLPLIELTDADGAPFDGNLAMSASILLRARFQGPTDPYGLLAPASGDADRAAGGDGDVELTISADNHDDLIIEAPAVYGIPSVDT